jgi:Mrp family chromosome partitioning ATPase/capsular polysaccharide biosynthesis protein
VAERSLGSSESVDTRRYLAAIRRDLSLIAAVTLGLTIFAFALSLALPKTYSAAARIGFDLTSSSASDSATMDRLINTQQELVTSRLVLLAAQDALRADGIKVDQQQLLSATSAQAVFNANLLEIRSSSPDPAKAAAYANAVADAFTRQQNGDNTSALNTQIRKLEQEADAASTPELRVQLESKITELTTQRNAAANKVVVARAAVVPGTADSPKPVRNAVLALFVGLFLGVLLALLRDQLRPRFTSQRDLAQFLELPVLASVPELGRRLGVRSAPQAMRVEQESYQSLSAALRLALPPSQTHVVLLTSSMHAEGKTTVSTRVARLLAASGQRTLLISGDLRWPRLDSVLGVDGKPGLSDLLAAQQSGTLTEERLRSAIQRGEGRERTSGAADVLPSGTMSSEAARLLSSGALEPLMDHIRKLGYTYVIVDATPLLGIADARLLARSADKVLVVGRLERISVPAAMDLRDELGRLGTPLLGLVVIGGTSEASPYYSGVKFVPPSESREASRTREETFR